jgi:large subunit ribosomal protein L9
MKVLLKENVENLGNLGDVVTVKSGYARNFLLPRNLAVQATRENEAQIAKIKKRRAELEAQRRQKYVEQAESLRGKSTTIMARVNEEKVLYGSVDAFQVAEAVTRDLSYEIDAKDVLLENAIRELGTYDVTLRVYPEVTTEIKLYVVAEE